MLNARRHGFRAPPVKNKKRRPGYSVVAVFRCSERGASLRMTPSPLTPSRHSHKAARF